MLWDARWDLVAWNAAAHALFHFGDLPVGDRNAAWAMFGWPRVREVLEDWPQHARRVLAALRAASAELLDDERFGALLDRLRSAHPEVRQWWSDYEVGPKTVAEKAFRHPELGRIEVQEVVLRPAAAPELQLVINLPRPGVSTDRMAAVLAAR
jgi:hypothetical protein